MIFGEALIHYRLWSFTKLINMYALSKWMKWDNTDCDEWQLRGSVELFLCCGLSVVFHFPSANNITLLWHNVRMHLDMCSHQTAQSKQAATPFNSNPYKKVSRNGSMITAKQGEHWSGNTKSGPTDFPLKSVFLSIYCKFCRKDLCH